jgi:hypothetical protein
MSYPCLAGFLGGQGTPAVISNGLRARYDDQYTHRGPGNLKWSYIVPRKNGCSNYSTYSTLVSKLGEQFWGIPGISVAESVGLTLAVGPIVMIV